jgi:hypothetical protein
MLSPEAREYLELKRDLQKKGYTRMNLNLYTSKEISVKDAERNIERMIKDW